MTIASKQVPFLLSLLPTVSYYHSSLSESISREVSSCHSSTQNTPAEELTEHKIQRSHEVCWTLPAWPGWPLLPRLSPLLYFDCSCYSVHTSFWLFPDHPRNTSASRPLHWLAWSGTFSLKTSAGLTPPLPSHLWFSTSLLPGCLCPPCCKLQLIMATATTPAWQSLLYFCFLPLHHLLISSLFDLFTRVFVCLLFVFAPTGI